MRYDVIIIGAGPAGLMAGITILRKSNLKVLLIERRPDPGVPPKPCARGISKKWIERLGLNLPEKLIASKIYGARLFSPNKTVVEWKFDRPVGYTLYRADFERMLINLYSTKLGGDFLCANFKKLLTSGVKTDQGEFESPVIIGADGALSRVRRCLGFDYDLRDYHICFQHVVEGNKNGFVEAYTGGVFAPKGYLWVFPWGKWTEIGVGVHGPLNPRPYLERFVSGKKLKVVFSEGGLVPTAGPMKRVTFRHDGKWVLLVGDAGFHASPLHGGGIAQGMYSGFLAGLAVAEDSPESYDKKRRKLYRMLKFHLRLRNIVYNMRDDELNKLAEILREFKPASSNFELEGLKMLGYLAFKCPSKILPFLFY